MAAVGVRLDDREQFMELNAPVTLSFPVHPAYGNPRMWSWRRLPSISATLIRKRSFDPAMSSCKCSINEACLPGCDGGRSGD